MRKRSNVKSTGARTNRDVHSFTLILGDVPEITSAVEDALFEAGCDDATLGSRGGVTYLEFDRAAESVAKAIQSAIRDVRRAGFAVARVEPDDLVTAAEIARRAARSRESIRQLISGRRGAGGFPAPVSSITLASPLWRWLEVAQWLTKHGGGPDLVPQADAIGKINALLEVRRRLPELNEVEALWQALEPEKPRKRQTTARR
jgi:hypothetical protein